MTSMPASRKARAMTFAPRSCPSSPGLATRTRIFLFTSEVMREPEIITARPPTSRPHPGFSKLYRDIQRAPHVPARDRAIRVPALGNALHGPGLGHYFHPISLAHGAANTVVARGQDVGPTQ